MVVRQIRENIRLQEVYTISYTIELWIIETKLTLLAICGIANLTFVIICTIPRVKYVINYNETSCIY